MKKILSILFAFALVMISCSEEEKLETPVFHIDDTQVIVSKNLNSVLEVPMYSEVGDITFEYDTVVGFWLDVQATNTKVTLTILEANDTKAFRDVDVYFYSNSLKLTMNVSQTWLEDGATAPDLVIGDLTPDGMGIIYWINPDDVTHGKAISIACLEGEAFDVNEVYSYNGAYSETDGATNTEYIIARGISDGTDPIAPVTFVQGLGDGWYIPAVDELTELFEVYNGTPVDSATLAVPDSISVAEIEAREIFDSYLELQGGRKINTADGTETGDSYWSSTEAIGVSAKVYAVRFGYYENLGTMSSSSTSRLVRGFKEINAMDYMEED